MKIHLAAGSYGHVLYGYDIDIDATVGLAVPAVAPAVLPRTPPPTHTPPLAVLHNHLGHTCPFPPPLCIMGVQGDSATFVARYSYEAHIKGITALGLAGKTLVSGGADEFIK